MKKVSEGRKREARPLDSSMKLNIRRGAGKVESMSLQDLKEEERKSTEWKMMLQGGVRVVPAVEFRLQHTKNVAKESNKKKEIDSIGVDRTDVDLEEVIVKKWEDLRNEGKTEEEAKKEILKMDEYAALQGWKDIRGEIEAKKAMEDLMKELKVPSLIVRSVEYNKLNREVLRALGVDLPDGEIDLLLAYVANNDLYIVLTEVKRPNIAPWESKEKDPGQQNINKALKQLLEDLNSIFTLLKDVPGSSIVIQVFTCFPETS